jgi:hypothetical protein
MTQLCHRKSPGAVAVAALALLACNSQPLKSSIGPGTARAPVDSGEAGTGGGGIGLPGGDGAAGGVSSPDGGEACAAETHAAKRSAVDLLFLVDVSPSMVTPWQGMMKTRGQIAKQAIFDFITDPQSAELGVALQYFPHGYIDKPCLEWNDCGLDKDIVTKTGIHLQSCLRNRYCELDGQPGQYAQCPSAMQPGPCGCAIGNDMCQDFKGSHCAAPGDCSVSHKMCPEVGKPCPGGAADGDCLPVLGKCNIIGDACAPAFYERLRVPFTDLPAGAKTFLDAADLGADSAGFSSPLVPAVQGSMTVLKKRAMQTGARPAALVLITSGVPGSPNHVCQPADPLAARADITAAATGTPAIPTYVIGVVASAQSPEVALVNQLAAAGGTGSAFVLDGTMDVSAELHQALGKIRSSTLACDFALPKPTAGGDLDVHKVNVAVKTTVGRTDLAYVGNAGGCSGGKGGWYYDVDPATGGHPSRVVLCPTSCQAIRADAAGSVDVAFGCTSRIE